MINNLKMEDIDMETVSVPKREIEWLLNCSDLQMGDGDTARTLIRIWLKGESAINVINEEQHRIGLDDLKA
jgi:hypothetical protein